MRYQVGQKLKLNLPEDYPPFVRKAKIQIVSFKERGAYIKVIGLNRQDIFIYLRTLDAFAKPLTRNIINK